MRWLFGLFVGEYLANSLASSLGVPFRDFFSKLDFVGNFRGIIGRQFEPHARTIISSREFDSLRCFRGAYMTISWGLSFLWQRGKTGPPSERWAKDLSFSSVSGVIWSVLAWASLSSPGRGGGEGIKFKSFL